MPAFNRKNIDHRDDVLKLLDILWVLRIVAGYCTAFDDQEVSFSEDPTIVPPYRVTERAYRKKKYG